MEKTLKNCADFFAAFDFYASGQTFEKLSDKYRAASQFERLGKYKAATLYSFYCSKDECGKIDKLFNLCLKSHIEDENFYETCCRVIQNYKIKNEG